MTSALCYLFAITCQIEEIGLLVILVEYGSRAELNICCRKYGNAILRQRLGKSCSPVMVFKGRYPRCHYQFLSNISATTFQWCMLLHSPGFNRCGWVSYKGWPNVQSAAETNERWTARTKSGLLLNVGDGRAAALNGGRIFHLAMAITTQHGKCSFDELFHT